jgi:hypothetical protein
MTGSRADIWRQRLWVWAVALTFLVLNCVGLLVYRLAYADRVSTLQTDLRDQSGRLAGARAERQRLEGLLRQARVNRERIRQLYDEHFSTRRRRLTGVTAEVQGLARRAGMVPRSLDYPEEQIQEYGLIKRSFVFTVEGTYTDLRKFINLLELSDSFLTLEDASLSEAGVRREGSRTGGFAPSTPAVIPGVPPPPTAPAAPAAPAMAGTGSGPPGTLRIGLTISTLFAAQDEPRDALAPLPGAGAAPGAGSGSGGGSGGGGRGAGAGAPRGGRS